jgi:hypothetical protein
MDEKWLTFSFVTKILIKKNPKHWKNMLFAKLNLNKLFNKLASNPLRYHMFIYW